MNEQFVLSSIPLRELDKLIQSSVERAINARQLQQNEPEEEIAQLLTVDELANFLHLSKATIYSNYSKGLIPGGCKQSKRLYFDKKIIIDWIKSGRKLSNAEIEAEAENYLATRKKGGRKNG